MMTLFFKRAIEDILKNQFLNLVTIITISLSILIVSAFILFFINTSEIIHSWQKGLRIMAYLKPKLRDTDVRKLESTIQALDGVQELRFISKTEAFNQLKSQMERQSSLFENLMENPLPDSFEIRMVASADSWQMIEALASRIEALENVDEVEYGQRWLGQFSQIITLFRLAGYAMGGLFFLATVFIVANTIRLVIYSRREEVEIMRLVGATDEFIKIPFYIEGLIQGALGSIMGLMVLFVAFFFVSSNVEIGFFTGLFRLQFLPPQIICAVILSSMVVGWLGCFISLKQFLND